ncbi:MAG TPA: hypothetical protein VK604_01005 [Bryobacteraceae bacterium]|nr:hypothetical protein [Bryobacteraceae bacterium]
MPELFFPQLTSGASAQYPIGKSRFIRTIQNVMADGSFYAKQDPGAGRLQWEFSYVDLSFVDITALQAHFDSCAGPVRGFTFIDPTDNMLASSADFTNSAWKQMPIAGLITLQPLAADPFGGNGAFTATNTSQVVQEITQEFTVPANCQYCLSVYARSQDLPSITLRRSGEVLSETTTYSVGPAWTRVVSRGRLNDAGTKLTVAIGLASGQALLYGPQLEAQPAPSRYCSTTNAGGVYPNAHWAVEELAIVAEAPNLYSVSFTIETAL